METVEQACCVCGYRVYKDIWVAVVGNELACERELTNTRDCCAVVVVKDGVLVGNLPKKTSRICSLLAVSCRVYNRQEASIYTWAVSRFHVLQYASEMLKKSRNHM